MSTHASWLFTVLSLSVVVAVAHGDDSPPRKALVHGGFVVDAAGPVPGFPGYAIARTSNRNHCTGIQIVTTRAKQVAPDDQPLADVFALEFPTGLDFSGIDKAASMTKFSAWLDAMKSAGDKARKHYDRKLAGSNRSQTVAVEVAARHAQVAARFASLLGRAEIPADVRTGDFASEKIDAYCDALAEAAKPLVEQAKQAAAVCAAKAKGLPAGWWTPLCTLSTTK